VAVWVGGSAGAEVVGSPAGVVGGGGSAVGDCWAVGSGIVAPPAGGGRARPTGLPDAFVAEADAEAPGEGDAPDTEGDGDMPFFPTGRTPPGSAGPPPAPSATLPALAGAWLGAFGPGSLPALTHAATPAATRVTNTAERTPATTRAR
jgi:hypothetical protein